MDPQLQTEHNLKQYLNPQLQAEHNLKQYLDPQLQTEHNLKQYLNPQLQTEHNLKQYLDPQLQTEHNLKQYLDPQLQTLECIRRAIKIRKHLVFSSVSWHLTKCTCLFLLISINFSTVQGCAVVSVREWISGPILMGRT